MAPAWTPDELTPSPTPEPSSEPSSEPSVANILLQNPLQARWTKQYVRLKVKTYLFSYAAFFVCLLAALLLVDVSGLGRARSETLVRAALQARVYSQEPATRPLAEVLALQQLLGRRGADLEASLRLSLPSKSAEDPLEREQRCLLSEYLLLKRCLLGCGDVLYEGGLTLPLLGRLPPGLAEDFLLHILNNHTVLSCCFCLEPSRFGREYHRIALVCLHAASFFLSNIVIVLCTAARIDGEYGQANENPGSSLGVNILVDVVLCAPFSLLLSLLLTKLYMVPSRHRLAGRALSAALLLVILGLLIVLALTTAGVGVAGSILQYLFLVLVPSILLDLCCSAADFEWRYYFSLHLFERRVHLVSCGARYLEQLLAGEDAYVDSSLWLLWGLVSIDRVAPPAAVDAAAHEIELMYEHSDSGRSSEFSLSNPLHALPRMKELQPQQATAAAKYTLRKLGLQQEQEQEQDSLGAGSAQSAEGACAEEQEQQDAPAERVHKTRAGRRRSFERNLFFFYDRDEAAPRTLHVTNPMRNNPLQNRQTGSQKRGADK